MATEAAETTDKKVEAPERIWLLQAVINHCGTKDLVVPPELRGEAVEYVRADAANARQRAERAAANIATIINRYYQLHPRRAMLDELADIIAAEFEK